MRRRSLVLECKELKKYGPYASKFLTPKNWIILSHATDQFPKNPDVHCQCDFARCEIAMGKFLSSAISRTKFRPQKLTMLQDCSFWSDPVHPCQAVKVDIHAAPRQGPPTPRSQGVISASVVVAPGQIFYAKFIQQHCI